jgi:hypothetical protein
MEINNALTSETIISRIFTIRNLKVMVDSDLAELYEVPTKRFNEQVKRNKSRFPADFMFQLTQEEYDSLRSQFAASKTGPGGRRYLPYVFTEHGAIMAATILNSQKAVEMSVFVIRAFIQLRDVLSSHKKLAARLDELERKLTSHDHDITMIINALRNLMATPAQKKRQIGFIVDEDDD